MAAMQTASDTAYFAFVGSYTTGEREARGYGITVFRGDCASGEWREVQRVPDLVNPCFLSLDRSKNILLSIHGDTNLVSSFAIDRDSGQLTLIGQQDTQGFNPCHVTTDPQDRFVVVSNYRTSTVATLPLGRDGSIGAVAGLYELKGETGPHRSQQVSALPHHALFDPAGRFLVVCDKGLDRLFSLSITADGRLSPSGAEPAVSREGAGPRHIAFHEALSVAYVINELDSTVTSYRYEAATGGLTPFQVLTCLPPDWVSDSRAAEIAIRPDGRFLYASCRRSDTIAVFAIDPATGWLTTVAVYPAGGLVARCFGIDPAGRFLFASNEGSDCITRFAIDAGTGRLTPSGTIATPSPACIVFAEAGRE